MQKILIEITTVNDAIPEKVAKTISLMTSRKCRLVIPPTKEEREQAADSRNLSPAAREMWLKGAQWNQEKMI